jgi:tight adherence protein B
MTARALGLAAAALCAALAAWWLVGPPQATRWMDLGPTRASGPDLRRLVARLQRGRRARERVRVVQALSALAAELHSGQPPAVALSSAAGAPPCWPTALAAVTAGDDIPAGLRRDARDHPALAGLAACWQVGDATGAGLADAVERLAQAARLDEESRAQLAAHLAGPRATARVLAALPVVGIGLGVLLGADPLGWLLGTALGWACLTLGVGLTTAGVLWTAGIARGVERRL